MPVLPLAVDFVANLAFHNSAVNQIKFSPTSDGKHYFPAKDANFDTFQNDLICWVYAKIPILMKSLSLLISEDSRLFLEWNRDIFLLFHLSDFSFSFRFL